MTSMAWQIPRAPLRASVVGVYAAGFAGVVALAVLAQQALGLGAAYPLKAAVVFGVVVLIGVGFVQTSHPFTRFGAANMVTTARAAGVALIAALVGEPGTVAAVPAAVGSVLVTLLDGVDGRLARQSGMASAFGARFDMEIDALLILALSILGWKYGKAGAWILLAGLLRYIFVAAGWVLPWLRRPLPPSWRRQAICVVQIVGLGLIVSPLAAPPSSAWWAMLLVAALLYSFLIDIIWLWGAR